MPQVVKFPLAIVGPDYSSETSEAKKMESLKNTKPRTLAEQARANRTEVELYVEIGQHNVILPFRDQEDKASLAIVKEGLIKLSEDAKAIIKIGDNLSFLMKLEIFLASRLYSNGPKIFRPTAEQLFALEKMKLNLEVRDFYSPYETIVIEFPEEYSKARTHQSERAINFSLFYCNKKENFFIHDLVYDVHGLKSYWMPHHEEEVLETWFEAKTDKDDPEDTDFIFGGDIRCSWSEYKLECLVRRAVCNYCLLLDECGTKQIGPAVPNQYNQLVKWCQKKNEHTRLNKLQLTAQPIIHGLKAVPTPLVRHVKSSSSPDEIKTGKIMPYHMRRGHYKMQPYGPKNELRKRIRIPATIINAHLAPGMPLAQEYIS